MDNTVDLSHDSTKLTTNDIYFANHKENGENESFYLDYRHSEEFKKYNASVLSTYPSGILLFGAICCIIFSIVGTFGNLVSILALVKSKRLRNATTALVVNLCVSDMLFCSTSMPQTAIVFIHRYWKYNEGLCKAFALIKFANGLASITTIIAITVNRYILIVHPKLYPSVYTRRKTFIIILLIWAFPSTVVSFSLFNVWGTVAFAPKIGDCSVTDLNGKSPRAFIFIFGMVLPVFLFIACYLRIYFVVKKSKGSIQNHDHKDCVNDPNAPDCINDTNVTEQIPKSKKMSVWDKKEFRLVRIVLVIFILYITSIFPLFLIKLFKQEAKIPVMNILSFVLYFSSSVIDPLIYVVMSREYRMAYKELFGSTTVINSSSAAVSSHV